MYAGGKKIFKIWGCKMITPAALALSGPQVPIKTLIILSGGVDLVNLSSLTLLSIGSGSGGKLKAEACFCSS